MRNGRERVGSQGSTQSKEGTDISLTCPVRFFSCVKHIGEIVSVKIDPDRNMKSEILVADT